MSSNEAGFLNEVTDEVRTQWKLIGFYFGYPKCCIDHFADRSDWINRLDVNQKMVHNNEGFIPCPNCSKKIVDGNIKIEDLIKNRICKVKYPNSGSIKSVDKFVEKEIK